MAAIFKIKRLARQIDLISPTGAVNKISNILFKLIKTNSEKALNRYWVLNWSLIVKNDAFFNIFKTFYKLLIKLIPSTIFIILYMLRPKVYRLEY